MSQNRNNEKLTIGVYTITPYWDGDYWIEQDDGEGMQVSKVVFEELIAKFYKETF